LAAEVHSDPETLATAVAARVRAAAEEAREWRGSFRMAVPGGRTPERLFQRLAEDAELPWDQVEIGFTDERAVPPESADSNYRLLMERLIRPLGPRAPRVERMPAEWPNLREAARASERWFAEPIDLVVLGLGEDGHIASLFPGSPLLGERGLRVSAVLDSPKPPSRRLTVTPRVLTEARAVLVMATGREKAVVIAKALAPTGSVSECPARLVRDAEWWIDRAASTALR